MSSNSQLASFPAKQPASAPPALTTNDTAQRRNSIPLGSNSAGGPRNIPDGGTPRNGQAGRKSHKNHRKPHTPRYGNDDHIDEDAMTLPSGGRKGTSITHLMNWNVASRPQSHHNNYRHGHNYRRTPTWGLGSGYHATDKARFINANYRFLVHPRGDYRAQAVDSDVHLPWDLVLQVIASEQTQRTNCPICLSTPVAPRMAKCGHIFCLPCLMRYMASTDDSKPQGPPEKKPRYKKCVICTDSIYSSEIRPVRFFVGQENPAPREGEDVVLRLVMRRQGSTLALPKEGAELLLEKEHEIPWHFSAEVMDYARVMKGTEEYMEEEFTREIAELEKMAKEDKVMFGEDGEWTRKAINNINVQKEGIKGMGNPPKAVVEPSKAKEKEKQRPEIMFNESDENVPAFYHVVHEASSGHSSSANSRSQSTTPSQQPSESLQTVKPPVPVPKPHLPQTHDMPYYFYQALPHYYLSSLDIRILKTAFGSYHALPTAILPRVENITTGTSVDDELRKRAKYVAHLPAGCEVGFLECDWTDIVPPEILDRFKGEIDRRRKKKHDKEQKEERDRIRAEKEEEALHRHRRRGSMRGFSEEDFVALATRESLNELPQPVFANGGEGSSSLPPPPLHEGEYASPGTSPSTSRTVWGTPLVLPQGAEQNYAVEREETGWWQDWEDDETLARLADAGGGGGKAPSHGKGGKKKKFKKVTLMTNGGKRGA
ncbi:uncharacterized protein H6S33_011267 [Morchella sextelata]|uniref:uncharacterized protein n=1 Tax=Morchella sextelata TaxID=1174677 RepID=UPI001D058539|nr:uncharacterized protein H6S33_011267 [Morchella sextelata]KAH0610840.1 hypothetical protein H6S33_011267 [Morchella sextelata]